MSINQTTNHRLLTKNKNNAPLGLFIKSQRPIDTFTEDEIQYAVRTQFSWTHLRSLLSISDPLVRQFYMQMCQYEHCRRGESTIFFVDMDTLPHTAHK